MNRLLWGFGALLLVPGVAGASGSEASGSEKDALEVVDAAYVCMVNDAAYEREQVRVEVGGKTYYGCCEMCKERLAKNETLRMAVDPVSGKEVDKATAVIGADAYRRVFYFESEETFEKFNAKAGKK